jgi:photosystem II stability/assembly factor-like uncharacterized protein
MSYTVLRLIRLLTPVLALLAIISPAQVFNTQNFSALKWRLIGPFRGGRVTAVSGVPGQPTTFLIGTPGGGIWRTTDAGRVWRPISDNAVFPAIGSLTAAPSDPRIIYAGTGERIPGQGMFKSLDSGATWSPIGLTTSRFIQSIVIDPHNPNIVVVGANDSGYSIIWHGKEKSPFTEGAGIFRTTDGGKTWTQSFSLPDSVGVVDLCSQPGAPNLLYASFYKRPAGTDEKPIAATSVLVKSINGGVTWTEMKTTGLPEKDLGRVGIAAAKDHRLYVIADQGFYRSDDGGLHWLRSTIDPRVISSEYFGRVFVDPNNPDTVFVSQTSMYRSTDGGHTFEAFAGAPSGDDYHLVWIDPADSNHIIFGVDQGAQISLNGGKTWSSWSNQPTGEFYNVVTDSAWPYRLYGSQQDSGTAAILSRSDNGQITPSDWYSISGFEYCHIAPDPLDPNIVYSGAWYGSVVRFDKRTGQAATIFDRGQKYLASAMPPLLFLPHDPQTLLLGMQYVLKTVDGGLHWREISPDLTVSEQKNPDSKAPKPAITALAASPIEPGLLWAGTGNSLVHLTRDGGYSWRKVPTPPGLPESALVSVIEPSHFNPAEAFIVFGVRHQIQSGPPLVFRTRDYGLTWQPLSATLPQSEYLNVVREDPVRKGLLYAGSESGVYVSFDDGDRWQSLQLNLPHAQVTDFSVNGADLVASTYGRALWILDDISPLRGLDALGSVLLRPEDAVRTHWDTYQDTPLPVETPVGANPPDGAIIDYYLASDITDVSLSIYGDAGNLVRTVTTTPEAESLPLPNIPSYWLAPPAALTHIAGLNRFVWDLRPAPPPALPFGYFDKLLEYTEFTLADHAIAGATPRQQPQAAQVLPGTYTLELSVGGKKYRQTLRIKPDPRVTVSAADLELQVKLQRELEDGLRASYTTYHQAQALRAALKNVSDAETVKKLTKTLDQVQTGTDAEPGVGVINRSLSRLQSSLLTADARPSDSVQESARQSCHALAASLSKWRDLNDKTLSDLRLPSLPIATVVQGILCQ